MKNKITWINCARFIAVLAVVIDHSSLILYNSEKFKMTTYFSVTVFILLSGYTTYISYQNLSPKDMGTKTLTKLSKILISYLIAVLIYQIELYEYFNLKEYFMHVIKFDLKGPFYFILIYIQYVIISPILVALVEFAKKQKFAILWQALLIIPIVSISFFCIHNSHMAQVYGGGQYLLGGSFFIFFYLGIVLACHPVKIRKKSYQIINCLVAVILWVSAWLLFISKLYFIDDYFQTGLRLNPPGLTAGIYALVTYWLLFSIFTILPERNVIIKFISYLGHCSLYIFLYHELCLIIIGRVFPTESYVLKWITYFPLMILAPVLVKYSIDKVKESITEQK